MPVALSVSVPQPTSVVQNVKAELRPAVTAATGLVSSPLGFIRLSTLRKMDSAFVGKGTMPVSSIHLMSSSDMVIKN